MTKPLPNPFMELTEVTYGPTPLGQLLHDLGFTKLSDEYLARKHHVPVAKIRDYRAAFKRGFKEGRAEARSKRT